VGARDAIADYVAERKEADRHALGLAPEKSKAQAVE
jgi:hypothetical protein